jgi:alpha-glucosidase
MDTSSTPLSSQSSAPITTPEYRLGLGVMMALMFMIGFLTCLNDILVPHLKQVFALNYTQIMLVNFTFFTAYFVMAIPSGRIIARIGYKRAIMVGLCTSGLAGVLFYPSAEFVSYPLFLFSLFVLASGFTLLQVAVNPFASALGPQETASARLTLTQAFNSLGTFIAPRVGGVFILTSAVAIGVSDPIARSLNEARSVQLPYLFFAGMLFLLALSILFIALPGVAMEEDNTTGTFRGAWSVRGLRFGVVGIFCYVGAEVAIGSLLINFMALPEIGGFTDVQGAQYVAYYWGGAMVGRFIGSALLARTKPGVLLSIYAGVAGTLCSVAVLTSGSIALWALIVIGLCNSIMFPNIFTLAIRKTGEHTGHATSLLTMGIVGGAIIPLTQGALADRVGLHSSFVLPIFCYCYILWFALRGWSSENVNTRQSFSLPIAVLFVLLSGATLLPLHSAERLSQSVSGVTSMTTIEHGVRLITKNAVCELTVYAPTIIRVRMAQTQDFMTDSRIGSPFSVVAEPLATRYTIKEQADHILLETDSLDVVIRRTPLRISFQTKSGRIINEDDASFGVSWIGNEVTNYKRIFPDERFLGLGEKAGGLDKRGSAYTNWNTDNPAYPTWGVGSDPLYTTIPFYIGVHSSSLLYGIFFDNTYKSRFNFGASNNRCMSFSADDGEMNYYFIYRSTIPTLIEDYTHLTGRMPLPPKWALGFQQSRWSYYPDTEMLAIARTMREKNFPCDVMYSDIHYMDDYKIFTWHPTRYKQPRETIQGLRALGMRLAVIVDPGIKVEKGYSAYDDGLVKKIFVQYPDGEPYTGQVWPGWCHFPDFTVASAREWWSKRIGEYVRDGVQGFWNDMNEPATWGQMIPDLVQFGFDGNTATHKKAHNIYGFQMARSSYEGAKKEMNARPLILTRAGYAGIQRYSAVWTGDNVASDDHMMLGVRLMSSMGISGVPFIGTDVGGFIGTTSKELFARWIAVGAFSPFFRVHKEHNNLDSEPWSYGETVEHIAREYIRLRYRLMPYLYSAFYQASTKGIPVLSPLALHIPFDKNAYDGAVQEQFMVGGSLMVVPVASTDKFRKVYLPKLAQTDDVWYDAFSDVKHSAGTYSIVETPIEKTPLFVRGGGILIMQSQTLHTGESPNDTLYLHLYRGMSGSTVQWYDDDGETYAYQRGVYAHREIRYDPQGDVLSISKQEGSMLSRYKWMKIIQHGVDRELSSLWQKGNVRLMTPYNEDERMDKHDVRGHIVVRVQTLPWQMQAIRIDLR